MKVASFSHGFLGGISLGNLLLLCPRYFLESHFNEKSIAKFNSVHSPLTMVLFIISLWSVFDRYDISHLDSSHCFDLILNRKRCVVIVIYMIGLTLHCLSVELDEKIFLQILPRSKDIGFWMVLNAASAFMALLGWFFVTFFPFTDMLKLHLENMKKYDG